MTAVTNADVTVIDVTGDVDRTRCIIGEVEALLRVDVQLIEFSPRQQSLTDKEVNVTDSGTTFGGSTGGGACPVQHTAPTDGDVKTDDVGDDEWRLSFKK